MVRAAALMAGLLLAGCEQSSDEQFAGQNARQAIWTNNQQNARLDEMQAEIDELHRRIDALTRVQDLTIEQIDQNARAANNNAIRDMTRRGACGTRLVRHESGVIENQRIPCTEADLRR